MPQEYNELLCTTETIGYEEQLKKIVVLNLGKKIFIETALRSLIVIWLSFYLR